MCAGSSPSHQTLKSTKQFLRRLRTDRKEVFRIFLFVLFFFNFSEAKLVSDSFFCALDPARHLKLSNVEIIQTIFEEMANRKTDRSFLDFFFRFYYIFLIELCESQIYLVLCAESSPSF